MVESGNTGFTKVGANGPFKRKRHRLFMFILRIPWNFILLDYQNIFQYIIFGQWLVLKDFSKVHFKTINFCYISTLTDLFVSFWRINLYFQIFGDCWLKASKSNSPIAMLHFNLNSNSLEAIKCHLWKRRWCNNQWNIDQGCNYEECFNLVLNSFIQ